MNTLRAPLVSALALGSASALGDWIWARYLTDGAVIPGIVHGVLIFVLLAVIVAANSGFRRTLGRLLATLPLSGALLAAAFYPIAYTLGYVPALVVTWCAMWLLLALLLRWVRGDDPGTQRVVVRGVVAAVASGLAFYCVSGMWTRPDQFDHYGVRLLLWTVAFLPGFLALLLYRVTGD